jgi:hypothetical protein
MMPRDVTSFTGRERELRDLLDSAAAVGRVVDIHAIGGMVGAGTAGWTIRRPSHP